MSESIVEWLNVFLLSSSKHNDDNNNNDSNPNSVMDAKDNLNISTLISVLDSVDICFFLCVLKIFHFF